MDEVKRYNAGLLPFIGVTSISNEELAMRRVALIEAEDGRAVLYSDYLAERRKREEAEARAKEWYEAQCDLAAKLLNEKDAHRAAEQRIRELESALEASERIRSFDYMPWLLAGGPEECEHKVAKGIACRKCDFETVRAALADHKAGGENG